MPFSMTPGRKFLYQEPTSGLRAELWRVQIDNPDGDVDPWQDDKLVALPYEAFSSTMTKIKYIVPLDSFMQGSAEYKFLFPFWIRFKNEDRNATAPPVAPGGDPVRSGYIELIHMTRATADVAVDGTTGFADTLAAAKTDRFEALGPVDIRFLVVGS